MNLAKNQVATAQQRKHTGLEINSTGGLVLELSFFFKVGQNEYIQLHMRELIQNLTILFLSFFPPLTDIHRL